MICTVLDDDVGLPGPFSKPHSGRFDADNAQRCTIRSYRATRQSVSLEQLIILSQTENKHTEASAAERCTSAIPEA